MNSRKRKKILKSSEIDENYYSAVDKAEMINISTMDLTEVEARLFETLQTLNECAQNYENQISVAKSKRKENKEATLISMRAIAENNADNLVDHADKLIEISNNASLMLCVLAESFVLKNLNRFRFNSSLRAVHAYRLGINLYKEAIKTNINSVEEHLKLHLSIAYTLEKLSKVDSDNSNLYKKEIQNYLKENNVVALAEQGIQDANLYLTEVKGYLHSTLPAIKTTQANDDVEMTPRPKIETLLEAFSIFRPDFQGAVISAIVIDKPASSKARIQY